MQEFHLMPPRALCNTKIIFDKKVVRETATVKCEPVTAAGGSSRPAGPGQARAAVWRRAWAASSLPVLG